MASMDQVAWATVNLVVDGEPKVFRRGDLLPEAVSGEEAAQRTLLRLGGALRMVEVVYTPAELAEQAQALGAATAAREAAYDVDPAAPAGDQLAGGGQPAGRPTMVEPSGAPVVIGNEELRAEHDQDRREAERRRAGSAGKPPSASGSKADWVNYAVDHKDARRADAEDMTRDELRREYGDSDTSGSGSRSGGSGRAKAPAGQAAAAPAKGSDPARNEAQTKPGAGMQPSPSAAEAPQAPAPRQAPAQDAPAQEWRDYAVSKGADGAKLGPLSRDQLIAAYGPASG